MGPALFIVKYCVLKNKQVEAFSFCVASPTPSLTTSPAPLPSPAPPVSPGAGQPELQEALEEAIEDVERQYTNHRMHIWNKEIKDERLLSRQFWLHVYSCPTFERVEEVLACVAATEGKHHPLSALMQKVPLLDKNFERARVLERVCAVCLSLTHHRLFRLNLSAPADRSHPQDLRDALGWRIKRLQQLRRSSAQVCMRPLLLIENLTPTVYCVHFSQS